MATRDHTGLLAELAEAYARYSPKSWALDDKAHQYLVDGGSHAIRLVQPFPPRIASAASTLLTRVGSRRSSLLT